MRYSTLPIFNLSIFIFLIGAFPLTAEGTDRDRQSLWLSSPTQNCDQGAVLLVHGLNLKPSVMDDLGRKLADSGLAVYRLALPGHRGESRQQRLQIKTQDLTQSLVQATTLMRQSCSGPLYAVGFSLGGLLTVVAQGEGLVNFDRMALIAPAIAIKSYAHLVTWLFPFFDIIPSRGPVPYRASKEGTSKALYRALFALYKRCEHLDNQRLLRPTRIYLNPDDELLNWSGVAKFIVDHNLEINWSLTALANDQAELNSFNHLIIDAKTLSPDSWLKLHREIKDFFSPPNKKKE